MIRTTWGNKKGRTVLSRLAMASAIAALALVMGGVLAGIADGEATRAYTGANLVRFHVMPHSDMPPDQDLKLVVRDAVLPVAGEVLAGATGRADVEARLRANWDRLQAAAQEAVLAAGSSHAVALDLGVHQFPARTTGNVAVGAGEYLALRIVIGEGRGSNWWCVLFPPLCFADGEAGGESSFVEGPIAVGPLAMGDEEPRFNEAARVIGAGGDADGGDGEPQVRIRLGVKLLDRFLDQRYGRVLQDWWLAGLDLAAGRSIDEGAGESP